MKKVNLGVIGAGRIGQIHAKNLKYQIAGANLMAISDVVLDAAKKAAAELEIPICEQDYQPILANKEIDAVVICSSTDTHAQIMIDAAQAGKHIFCEKPIALEMATIDKALEAVAKSGVKLQLGFNRRYDPSFKKAQEMVKSGAIGTPQVLKITSRDPQPPPVAYVKVSGGLFLDMAIHDFDMARYIMGDIDELQATGACLVDPEIGKAGDIDTAVVTLKFASGALGVIDNSRKAIYGYDQRIEIFGSEGCIIVGNKTPTQISMNKVEATYGEKPLYFFLERYQESYLAELSEFVSCVQENKQPSVSGIDGKISVLIGYAANESMRKGCFVKVAKS